MKIKHYKNICLDINNRYLIFATTKNVFDYIIGSYKNIPKEIIDFKDKINYKI